VTITKELQEALFSAINDAKRRRHEYLTLEHVLFAMAGDKNSKKILRAVGVELKELQTDLEQFFAENIDPLPEGVEREPQQTPTFQRVLQRAAIQVQSAGKETIDAGHLLASFFREPSSHAVYLLEKQGVTRLDVLEYISHGTSKVSEDGETVGHSDDEAGFEMGGDDEEGASGGSKKNALEAFATDLTKRAAEGKIDPLVGRAAELERTVQVLCRRRKNNPIFVGDPGVGKTAIVEGLALRVHEGKVPSLLKDAKIYSLDMGSLIAGTKFRGEFEARLKGILAQIQKQPNAILFIDEIHTIYGAGATGSGALDASNLLKPALANGQLKCIGSTTFSDYKSVFEKDRALARRFQKIDVLEPSIDETVEILKGLKKQYEEHHQVVYTSKAIKAAAELSAKHINDRLLPDKAVDVIDEAGAMVRLRGEGPGSKITSSEIESVVAKMARIPTKTVSSSDRDKLGLLDGELKQVIFGQDAAIENLVSSIKLSRSGLGSPEKPVGSFLFSGPTGVGKTELAKQLAKVLGIEFLRFDMSEYMEKHTVSRLIGAPPGYVGFDQGGMLTDAIRKTPHAVLVLDEIEKAHPDVFNILLQVMDHATLTDNNGRKADFRNIIIVMTTNAGAQELTRESLGFGSQVVAKKDKAAIERTFSPEFRNRLDGWITFGALAPATIDKVVDKFVRELVAQLGAKNVKLELNEEARVWLRDKGYDKLYGARPMRRVIQNELKRPLADAILFGALNNGGKATVTLGKDSAGEPKLVINYESAPPRPAEVVLEEVE
jgi:ATP-dependent Clp protease ATP-binding subunit ClpA